MQYNINEEQIRGQHRGLDSGTSVGVGNHFGRLATPIPASQIRNGRAVGIVGDGGVGESTILSKVPEVEVDHLHPGAGIHE